jgi:hypothetical protein
MGQGPVGSPLFVDVHHPLFAAVEIFFDSLAVKVVERHEKMPIQELISNAGGLIGLSYKWV